MATLAANIVAHQAAAGHGAAPAGAGKTAAGIDALFAALLSAVGGDGTNAGTVLPAAQTKQTGNAVSRLAELLNGSAYQTAKTAAFGTAVVKPVALANASQDKDKDTNTEEGNTVAQTVLAALAGTAPVDAPATNSPQTQPAGIAAVAGKDRPAPENTEKALTVAQSVLAALTGTAPANAPTSNIQPLTPAASASAAGKNRSAQATAPATNIPQDQPAGVAVAGGKDRPAQENMEKAATIAQSVLAALAGTAAVNAPASNVPRTPPAETASVSAGGNRSVPANPTTSRTPAAEAAAQAGGKTENSVAKAATQELPAQHTQDAQKPTQPVDEKSQAAIQPDDSKALNAALTTLQTEAGKILHQDIPVEKTAGTLPLQSLAATAGTDGQSGNGASFGTNRHDTPSETHQDRGTNVPGKSVTTETAAAPVPANGNSAAAAPDANAGLQNAAQSQSQPVPVSATLQVAPQNAAHAVSQGATDNQAVPLANLGALAVSIAARSEAGTKHFDIDLHPAELGSIHVRLSVDHTGLAQAHLRADTPQTLALLQRDSHSLERALKDAGLNLAGNGLNFSLKGEERQSGKGAEPNGRARTLSLSAVASAAPAGMASIDSLTPDSVRLDIRV